MDLILWRHADAEEGAVDLKRKLTQKGEKQAARMAKWLLERLPQDYVVLSSPATRALDTAKALGAKIEAVDALAPGASPSAIVKAAGWPRGERTVIVVGHQPDLGVALAQLVAGQQAEWRIKKGAIWWLADGGEAIVKAVISPDLL